MARRMYRHTKRPAARVVRAESRAHRLAEQNRGRLLFVMCSFAFVFGLLVMRLIEVSTIGGGELPFKRLVAEPELMLRLEEKNEADAMPAPAKLQPRLPVLDRNGMVLATNVPTASLAANPTLIREPQKVARLLAARLSGVNEAKIRQDLLRENSRFAYIKRHLTPAEQQAVHELGIPGLFFERGMRRVYPMGAMTAHLLGYVDIDNRGLGGIEQQFDKKLHYASVTDKPLKLSIDMRLQALMYDELKATMREFSAIGAAGIIMDVENGELLSLVSLPSFDPHKPALASEESRFNRFALGTYELGSIFKSFTVALGLESGAVSVRDAFDTTRPIQIGRFKITDYHPYHRWLSVREIFTYSSNIGTVKMLEAIGFNKHKEFLKTLGFDKPVPVELPERAAPQFPKDWKPVQHMTISYGHGISVTPLHLVRGMAALVNGGKLTPMTVLRRDAASQQETRQVIQPQTSELMRGLMRDVVEYGTARKAKCEGYSIGGKTGTADKIVGGRYMKNARISSIVTMFPAENPRYMLFIMVDDPKATKATYGFATAGWVAAPVVSRIVARMGPMMGIPPRFEEANPVDKQYWVDAETRNKQAAQRLVQQRSGGLHVVSY